VRRRFTRDQRDGGQNRNSDNHSVDYDGRYMLFLYTRQHKVNGYLRRPSGQHKTPSGAGPCATSNADGRGPLKKAAVVRLDRKPVRPYTSEPNSPHCIQLSDLLPERGLTLTSAGEHVAIDDRDLRGS